jgi:hypothetical protein
VLDPAPKIFGPEFAVIFSAPIMPGPAANSFSDWIMQKLHVADYRLYGIVQLTVKMKGKHLSRNDNNAY